MMKNYNPIIRSDFPDPDVIRVEDTYYMVSTTMHFMPGCVILRSYDLINWEVAGYVYDRLDDTPEQKMDGNRNIYGQGMWAASIRYHHGVFYICFVANDTHKTYLYRSESILGPWKKQNIEGFYHDSSLLFDDDGRVYIVYGNMDIYMTELKPDLTGPLPGGLNRLIIKDREEVTLGYEGSHVYKINGKYYVFLIHWLKTGSKRRVEACFVSDSPEGEFVGGNILDDDLNFHNQGVAQGGIVDTPDGDWYAMLFQDHGAVGRIPVLVPMRWEHDFPVFGVEGKVPVEIKTKSTRPGARYEPLSDSDDFGFVRDSSGKIHLKTCWQFNHTPDDALWSVTDRPGHYRIRSGKISRNVCQSVNTLTQRMTYPRSEASVTVDAGGIHDGDYAGICALQGCYGLIAVTRDHGEYFLVMLAKESKDSSPFGERVDEEFGTEFARVPLKSPHIRLKVSGDFRDQADLAEFFYLENGEWRKLGITHQLVYKLDHFTGCRFGLFLFSTLMTGGTADFSEFRFTEEE